MFIQYFIRYKNKKGIKSFNSARIKTVNKSIPSLNQIKQQTDTGSNSIYISDLLSVDNISERYLKVDKTIFLSLDYTKVRLFSFIFKSNVNCKCFVNFFYDYFIC